MHKTRLLSGITIGDHCTDHGDYGRKSSCSGVLASDQPERTGQSFIKYLEFEEESSGESLGYIFAQSVIMHYYCILSPQLSGMKSLNLGL